MLIYHCAHGDKTKSLETHTLKTIPLGRVSQEHLMLCHPASTAPGPCLPGQSKTFLICEHLSSHYVLAAVRVCLAIGRTMDGVFWEVV